jgi:Ca-activated chloride channel family protein
VVLFVRLLKLQMLALAFLLPITVFAANPAVLFVVDSSGSMWGRIGGTEKVYVLRDVLSKFISRLPQNIDVGLVAYGHRNKGDCSDFELLAPIGSSHKLIINEITSISPKGRTPLSGSIDFAIRQIKKWSGNGTIILLSDGVENCGGDPCKAASAAGKDIRIHMLALDVNAHDYSQLSCIATNSGGRLFTANSKSSLEAAFASIGKEITDEQFAAEKAAAEKAAAEKACC